MVQLGPLRVVCAAGSSGDSDNTYLGLAGQPGKESRLQCYLTALVRWQCQLVQLADWLLLPATKST